MNIKDYQIIEKKLDENNDLISALIECNVGIPRGLFWDYCSETFRYLKKTGWFDRESFKPVSDFDSQQLNNLIYNDISSS